MVSARQRCTLMAYVIYIVGERANEGVYTSYWYPENPLGTAISQALRHARDEFPTARVDTVEHDPRSEAPDNTLPTDTAPLRHFKTLHTWRKSADDPDFWFPVGVVPTPQDEERGGIDPTEIREGYAIEHNEDEHALHVVVDARRLWQVFTTVFRALPSRDGLEIRLLAHWEEQEKTQVWLAPPDFSDDVILSFIQENSPDLVDNGGVELAVYCRSEQCTLRLTEHKTLVFYADDAKYLGPIEEVVKNLGFAPREPLLSIVTRCGHYHYALPGTASRSELAARLNAAGLQVVDEY